MIRWLIWLFWGPHNCERYGHRYFARYDNVIDPRLSREQIQSMWKSEISSNHPRLRRSLMATMYIRDVCRYCGDTIDRIEGLNAMEVLAHQAKRIA